MAKSVPSDRTVEDMAGRMEINQGQWEQYRSIKERISEKGKPQTITLNSPWQIIPSSSVKQGMDPQKIRRRKNDWMDIPPSIVIRDGENRIAINGGTGIEVARMNRKMVPCIEISKELYHRLREEGFEDKAIISSIYHDHTLDLVPQQVSPEKTITGLIYRDEIIPMDVILENYDALKTMKNICESKELQKALEEIFEETLIEQ